MRFFEFTAVATFSTAVLAQGFDKQVPQCAQSCFSNNLGSCTVNDIACICGNTAVIDKVSCCIYATCPQSDIAATTELASQLCKLENVVVITAPSCPSGDSTASVSASSTPTSTPTMAVASTAAAPIQTAGAGVGFGMAVAGFLIAL